VDWLVDGLLVGGEVTVVSADSGTGKSWFASQLALAVAGDDEDDFLGLPLRRHGNVLVVDEENPEDLVYQRLNALGLKPHHLNRLDYLAYTGVDLAHHPQLLLEQAIDFDPVLIVLDSLSRIAPGVEENSNTEMSALFRNAIVPLSRETGASVVVVHHTTKDGGKNPRGAGAIKAAADEAIQMVAAESRVARRPATSTSFRASRGVN
jgi:RecA-family ATPase